VGIYLSDEQLDDPLLAKCVDIAIGEYSLQSLNLCLLAMERFMHYGER
jgi:hypothetical protein